MKKLILKTLFLLCVLSFQLNAQLSTREIPIGFKYNFGNEMPIIVMPAIDTVALLAEDEIEEQQGISFLLLL